MSRSARAERPDRERLVTMFTAALDAHKAGHFEEAKNRYLKILAIDVHHAPSLFGLGTIAQHAGSFDVAEKMMQRALAVDHERSEYHFALGIALQAQGKLRDALAAFRSGLQRKPDHRLARFRVGNLLQLEGKLDEARANYEQILQADPGSHDAEFNIGNICRLQRNFTQARVHYNEALRLQSESADAQWNLGLLDLLEGDYASGWPRYEARHRRPTPNLRAFPQPQWNGGALNGARILLHAEQGLGDTLQFLRYVPMVVATGARVLLDVPKEIRRLAAEIEGISNVLATGDSLPEFEWQCPLMSLPLAFQTTLDSIPARAPYLRVPEEARQTAEKRSWPESGLRVGLVWAATTHQFEDSDRSIPVNLFEPILSSPGIHFFSLQVGPPAKQLESLRNSVTDLREAIADLADTAALIESLDLVITVDTSVAHLAGALAKPTWILLPFSSEWRWLTNRSDSPWYPTVRLFRQHQPRNWHSVLEQVLVEIEALARKSTS